MSRTDLNIVDRGIRGSKWTAEDVGLTADHLDEVMEQKTDNSGALNSLPTPFARFFVAREAFRRAKEEHLNTKKEAGFAYRQLVSDILDVYEILFNLKYHKNNTWKNGQKLELREWDFKGNMEYLKEKMPILYNSLYEYYQTDIAEKKLYFLVYTEDGKEHLLACSSPYTGFVTPPDMDKAQTNKDGVAKTICAEKSYDTLRIRRKSGGYYFKDIKMFEDREQDFKNYMYNNLFGSNHIDDKFKNIKEYVRSFKEDQNIRNDFNLKLINVQTEQNDALIINGISFMSSDEIDVTSYFTTSIIRLPYRISRKKFKSVVYQNDNKERNYDYLLPFKPEVLSLFNGEDIASELHINRNSVTVYLKYNGKTYEKEYATDEFKPGIGKIIDLAAAKINFDFGIFPNILSYKEQENNYFKIFVVASEKNTDSPNFNIDQLNLSFFKNNSNGCSPIRELDPASTGANFGVLPAVVRSRQKSKEVDGSTKLYELFNSSFDALEVSLQGNTGLLLPIWEVSKPTNDTFTYAIDLGTSNTFMSRCKNGQETKPELFKMDQSMVSFLHEVPDDQQISISRRIEDSIFDEARGQAKTEFIPAIIDGADYKFPIRTAVCGKINNFEKPHLFDNYNIAFFYEKFMAYENQNIQTDIKWEKNEDVLRIFIRELLLIVKCDILQRNGDLNSTKLVWFRPLSFMGNIRQTYNAIWKEEPENVLFIPNSQINCFSESEAPYYYFKKKDYIKDSDTATVIDIGGGSTDFVYFKDNQPQMANSVHFGCDVLWENGLMEFQDEKENGIYQRYSDSLRFDRSDLEDLNTYFKNTKDSKTKDIINFWLSNSKFCDISKRLSQDFKPVFIYHLTAILYYMAYMYKENGLEAPRTVVFSGNGSKYIDNFICSEIRVLKNIIELVFERVFGGEHHVHLELPTERKESTCYGGLYRKNDAPDVPEKVYQGDVSRKFETVGDINNNFDYLSNTLINKYKELSVLYKDVLDLFKREHILDNTANTSVYVEATEEDMHTPFKTYYKSNVKEKYGEEVVLYDSVFFLPIINKIFEMTKL